MSYFAFTVRRRLFAIAALADFSIFVNGVEYKPGDTVIITASTTVTVKGNGKAKVTLIGAGGGGAGALDSSLDYQGGSGGDGGTSIFTTEITSGNHSVICGTGGKAGGVGTGGTGGETSAFGHSASGGTGGSAASEWYDGSNGQNGTGETSSGNTTEYGQGGDGDWYSGKAGGDGVCIIKVLDPNSNDCTIVLSGTFDASNSYVTIAGEKITTPGEYLVPVGDFITLSIKKASSFGNTGGIYINGTCVVYATTTLQSYDYEVEGNCMITGEVSGSNMARSYTIKVVSE